MNEAQEFFRQWWAELPQERQQEIVANRPQLSDFRASRGWLSGFLSRNGFSFRKQCKNSTALPENADELVANFQETVAQTVEENGINQVLNMNETFALWDMAPQYTYNVRGAKQIDVRTSRGNPKLGCTVTLCITFDGRKMPASVIFRGLVADGEEIEELRENAPENVRVTGSVTGWASWQTILSWVTECLFPFVEDALPFLLIWDMFPAHRNGQVQAVVEDAPGFIEMIPGRCTSLVQPLDKTIIRSFKSNLRKGWKAWKIENNDERGRSPLIQRDTVLRLIGDAWARITEEAIHTAWRACNLLQPHDEPVPEHVDQDVIDFGGEDDADDGLYFQDVEDE